MEYPTGGRASQDGHAAQVLCGLGHVCISPRGMSAPSPPDSPSANEGLLLSSDSSRREMLDSRRELTVMTVEQKHARWQNELAQALELACCPVSRLLLDPATHLNTLDTALFMSRLLPREIAALAPALRKVWNHYHRRFGQPFTHTGCSQPACAFADCGTVPNTRLSLADGRQPTTPHEAHQAAPARPRPRREFRNGHEPDGQLSLTEAAHGQPSLAVTGAQAHILIQPSLAGAGPHGLPSPGMDPAPRGILLVRSGIRSGESSFRQYTESNTYG